MKAFFNQLNHNNKNYAIKATTNEEFNTIRDVLEKNGFDVVPTRFNDPTHNDFCLCGHGKNVFFIIHDKILYTDIFRYDEIDITTEFFEYINN